MWSFAKGTVVRNIYYTSEFQMNKCSADRFTTEEDGGGGVEEGLTDK